MNFDRWYPSAVTLGNGQIVLLGGRDHHGDYVGYSELYTPGVGWQVMPDSYLPEFSMGLLYPRTWVNSSGDIICVTPGFERIYAMDPSSSVQRPSSAGCRPTRRFRPGCRRSCSPRTRSSSLSPTKAAPSSWTSAASRRLRRSRRRRASILLHGPQLGKSYPARRRERAVERRQRRRQREHGRPLHGFDLESGEQRVDWLMPSWCRASITWLVSWLPDATVLSMGGGAPGPADHLDGQIYKPAYLFDADGTLADRPVITTSPRTDAARGRHLLDLRFERPSDQLAVAGGVRLRDALDELPCTTVLARLHAATGRHLFRQSARQHQLAHAGLLDVVRDRCADGTPSVAATIQVATEGVDYTSELGADRLRHRFRDQGRAFYDVWNGHHSLTPDAANEAAAVMSAERVDLHHVHHRVRPLLRRRQRGRRRHLLRPAR